LLLFLKGIDRDDPTGIATHDAPFNLESAVWSRNK